MPAERTTRPNTHGTRLPWASVPTQTIEFAPNVTPTTFSEPPPLVDFPEPENCLFPPSPENEESLINNLNPKSGKKRRASYIPRPPNAFILFRSSFVKNHHVSTSVEKNHSTLSKIIGLTWSSLSAAEREVWYSKAKMALAEHRKRWPEYSFRPSNGAKVAKTNSTEDASQSRSTTKNPFKGKRKPREVPTDQRRCEQIAKFLVEGLKGEELDVAIEEFDKSNAPLPPVTRFDEPVTEQMFRRRRSSSVPGIKTSPTDQRKFSPPPRRPSSCGPSETNVMGLERNFTFDNYGVMPRLDTSINWNTPFELSHSERVPELNAFTPLSPFDTSRIHAPSPQHYSYSPISPLENFDIYKAPSSSYSGMSTPALSVETTFMNNPTLDPTTWTPVTAEYVPTPIEELQQALSPYDLTRGPVATQPDTLDLSQLDFDLSNCAPATFNYPTTPYAYPDMWTYSKPEPSLPRATINLTWTADDGNQQVSLSIPPNQHQPIRQVGQ